MYTGNPHSRRAEGITPIGLSSMSQPAAAPRPNMNTMGGWFKGGPVDSPSPFTQGFQQGWGDQRSQFYGGDNINLPIGKRVEPEWAPREKLNTGAHESMHGPLNPLGIGDQASYVPSERVYPKFVIDDLLRQGVTVPSEIRQIAPDSFQITPRGMTPSPLRPRAYYT